MADFGVGNNPYIVRTNPPAIPQQMAPPTVQPANPQFYNSRQCCCLGPKTVDYKISFGANVAVPTGETLGPITVAIAVDGATLNGTIMESTPAAVEEYNSISREAAVPIFYDCCQTVTVRNTSPIPISVRNAIIRIEQ